MELDQIKKALLEFDKPENNIENIFNMNLCNYCGACILVCPEDAIEYGDAKLTINDSCKKCGNCLEICSQNQKERYQSELFERESNDKISSYYTPFSEIPIGDFANLYNCSTGKKEVLNHSMVGGTTLTLLILALEEKLVDAVIITDFEKGKQFPVSKVTKEKSIVLKSGGSRYLPTFSLQILDQIEKDNSIQSVAITTLPCQAYAIKKLSMQEETRRLIEKVKFVFTLLCGSGLPSRRDIEQFLIKQNIESDLSQLEVYSKKEKKFWRLNPQAQRRYIYMEEDGSKYDFSSSRILRTKTFPNCSSLCSDYTGFFSDISIGGANIASNFVIARTNEGDNLVKKAIEKGYLMKKKRFSKLDELIIIFMGKNKREKNRNAFQKIFS